VAEVGLPKIGPVQEAIGKYVADMIPDGATLQIGYGGIPDAVVMQLTHKQRPRHPHRNARRRHPDADRVRCGHQPGQERQPRQGDGHLRAGFAQALRLHAPQSGASSCTPRSITNDPWLAGQNDNLIAINATMQIDLIGQCGSETLGWLPVLRHRRDSPISCVRPTAPKGARPSSCCRPPPRDSSLSRIVPTLTPGHPCQHQQERHQLRGHRVRRGAAARQDGPPARRGADRHRAPGLPR
jgi:hypothetical protein